MILSGLPASALQRAPELPCRWERLNLDGGGYIGRIVTDPNRAGRVYCLSDKGGIHRSDDGGKSWVMKNRGFFRETHYGVSDLVIDPKNPDRLVAAVGNAPWAWKFWYPGAVMVSSDGAKAGKNGKFWAFPAKVNPAKAGATGSISRRTARSMRRPSIRGFGKAPMRATTGSSWDWETNS